MEQAPLDHTHEVRVSQIYGMQWILLVEWALLVTLFDTFSASWPFTIGVWRGMREL